MGITLPLHCTAVGKVHLAFDAEGQLKTALPESLQRYTDRTIVDRATLFEQLEAVARDGYAMDSGEFIEEVSSVAVPIRDYTRSVVGSVAVAGPTYRIGPSESARRSRRACSTPAANCRIAWATTNRHRATFAQRGGHYMV